MKKLIILALIIGGMLNHFTKTFDFGLSSDGSGEISDFSKIEGQQPIKHHAEKFRCDGRQYCSQMNSRAEAEFFLANCPNTKMDGDHDGTPCENDSRF